SARDRRSPHPHGHHRREVERGDAADDAERLPYRIDVDPGRGLLAELALEQLRNPAAVLDHLEPPRDLALRVAEDLAVLGGEDARDVVLALDEQLTNAEEDCRLARERRRPPGGVR